MKADLVAGIIGFIISVVTWHVSGSFPAFEVQNAGPSFFPRVLSILLALLSVAIIYEGLKNKEEVSYKMSKTEWIKFLSIIILLVVYYFTMNIIGYFTTTFVLSFVIALIIFGSIHKKILIYCTVNSGIICLTIYLVFRMMLKAPLPYGLLF